MIAFRYLVTLAVLAPSLALSQNVASELDVDPVLKAIQDFNERDVQISPEISLTPTEPGVSLEQPKASEEPPSQEKTEPAEPAKPILVTGKPPENVELAVEQKPAPSQEVPQIPKDEGFSVDVEKLQSGKGVVQSGNIKLLAPFPAKPLSNTPAGWQLDPQAEVPLIRKEIELSPGQKITLTIRPHLLTPVTDGSSSFTIREPGYDPALGYQQTQTVGAILANSLKQQEESAKLLGNAIDNLQQLLVSLPNPEAQVPAETPVPSVTPRSR